MKHTDPLHNVTVELVKVESTLYESEYDVYNDGEKIGTVYKRRRPLYRHNRSGTIRIGTTHANKWYMTHPNAYRAARREMNTRKQAIQRLLNEVLS